MKAEAIEGLYDQLETVEGQQEIYRLQLQGTDQARTYARYAMSKVQQEKV